MDIIIVGNYLDSAPYLDIKFLDFQCAHCLCQLEKRDRSPNSLHLHCPNCSKSGILERSTSLATECLRKGIQRDVSPTTLAKPCAEERRDIGRTSHTTAIYSNYFGIFVGYGIRERFNYSNPNEI